MAARTTPHLSEQWKEKIQTSMLINRLVSHAKNAEETPLLPTQIKAIEILLRKTIPDLKAVEHSGEMQMQISKIEEVIVDPQG